MSTQITDTVYLTDFDIDTRNDEEIFHDNNKTFLVIEKGKNKTEVFGSKGSAEDYCSKEIERDPTRRFVVYEAISRVQNKIEVDVQEIKIV